MIHHFDNISKIFYSVFGNTRHQPERTWHQTRTGTYILFLFFLPTLLPFICCLFQGWVKMSICHYIVALPLTINIDSATSPPQFHVESANRLTSWPVWAVPHLRSNNMMATASCNSLKQAPSTLKSDSLDHLLLYIFSTGL